MNFCTIWRPKFTKLTNSRASKTAILELLYSLKLISHKIWISEWQKNREISSFWGPSVPHHWILKRTNAIVVSFVKWRHPFVFSRRTHFSSLFQKIRKTQMKLRQLKATGFKWIITSPREVVKFGKVSYKGQEGRLPRSKWRNTI